MLISERDGSIVPLISDFGYSTISDYGDDGASILLPHSRHWSAPEHTYDAVTFEDARKMDVYSMGLLCLWLLFYDDVSGSAALPLDGTDDEIHQYFPCSWNASIDEWTQSKRIDGLISLLMTARKTKGDELRVNIGQLLLRMLDPSPKTRLPSLDEVTEVLSPQKLTSAQLSNQTRLNDDQSRDHLNAEEVQQLLRPGMHVDFCVGTSTPYAGFKAKTGR